MISIANTKLTEKEIEAAVRVMRSGALREGKVCQSFEKKFKDKVGCNYTVSCSSGTAGLHLAYLSFIEPGDEVLVPSFTFIATGSMVVMAGGKPVFCDVNPQTFLIDLEDAEHKITSRTRAIAPVHIFGNVCDIDEINNFSKKHNLIVVWDAAQAHGALFKEKDIGSFGDFVCYSFYPSKNMFVGEGGMVCTDNPQYADNMRFIKSHGQTDKYYHTMIGLNYRMTDVEASIGGEQLERLDDILEKRRKNAGELGDGILKIHGITPQRVTSNSSHGYHQYCVLVDKNEFGMDRNELAARMKKEGVVTAIHYPRGLHQQPVFEKMYGQTNLPACEKICEEILALPVHQGLNSAQIEYILESIEKIRYKQ